MYYSRKIVMIAAVILAGGSSKRFGVNKLTYEVNGEAMIRRVFNAAKEITENIYLSVKNREQAISLIKVCDNPSGVIEDSYSEVDGPINGIITSLKKLQYDEIVIIPGDMPYINSEALIKFVDNCSSMKASSGSIYWPNGVVNVLLQYHRREETLRNINLIVLRGCLAKASDTLRASQKSCYIPVDILSKDARTFINVNTPDDLLPRKFSLQTLGQKIKCIEKDTSDKFLKATFLLQSDPCLAVDQYVLEGESYEADGLYTLSLHAYNDAKICIHKCKNVVEKKIDDKINRIKSLLFHE